jgi:hypothetical protein
VTDHGDGTYRFYTLAIDRAGNVEAAPSADSSTRVAADQLDSHAPGISSPNQGASYQQNASAAAAFTCTDEAGGSGVASCDGSVANGAALDTSTAGQRSYTVTATDRAGNTRTATIAYAVSEQHVEGEHHDTSAPHLNTTATKRNQPLRGSALSVDVSCDEACTLSAGGTISVPGAAKVHRLKTAAGRGGQGSHVRLAPRLDRATLRAVRKALKRRGRVVAKLTVSATDAAGNVRTTTLTLRVTKA